MNQTAQSLGLNNTSYANPIGLDDPNNYSTARDLVTLANLDLQNPLFARIVNTQAATLHSGDHTRQVTSRNTLLNRAPWVDGVKTGHTLKAGYVLVGSGTQNSTTLISAVLGTPNEAVRDGDTFDLLNYGFSLYHPTQPVDRGAKLADPGLDYRSGSLPLVARRALRVSVRPGQHVGTQVQAPSEVSGAIKQGQVLGRVTATVDGKPADSSPLVASETVGAATFFDKVVSVLKNPIFLLFLVAIVIVVGVLLSRRRQEPAGEAAAIPRPRRNGRQGPTQRTPEERRRMHQERMRRRRDRMERKGGSG
jgi:serine-type D-Ala-D-Ala carboxypeptidase (penicillin-binding protein 5/6)